MRRLFRIETDVRVPGDDGEVVVVRGRQFWTEAKRASGARNKVTQRGLLYPNEHIGSCTAIADGRGLVGVWAETAFKRPL